MTDSPIRLDELCQILEVKKEEFVVAQKQYSGILSGIDNYKCGFMAGSEEAIKWVLRLIKDGLDDRGG